MTVSPGATFTKAGSNTIRTLGSLVEQLDLDFGRLGAPGQSQTAAAAANIAISVICRPCLWIAPGIAGLPPIRYRRRSAGLRQRNLRPEFRLRSPAGRCGLPAVAVASAADWNEGIDGFCRPFFWSPICRCSPALRPPNRTNCCAKRVRFVIRRAPPSSIRARKPIASSSCCTAIFASRRRRRRDSRSVVRYVSAGELFGVAQAMNLTHYPATAVAAVDSIALAWPSSSWHRLIAKYPSLASSALQTVGSRLQDTQARVMEISNEQVEQRVAHALLRLAKQAGRRSMPASRSIFRSAGRTSPR